MPSFKVIVGPGRLSFPHLFTPQEKEGGGERYSTAFLLPPDTDLAPIKDALIKAMKDGFGPDVAKWPRTARKPDDVLVPADEKYGAAFKGWTTFNCSSSTKPGVVNAMVEKVTDSSEAYPGRWAKLSLSAFSYKNKTQGVTLGLGNVQLLKHDEPLAGKARAEDEFEAVAAEMSTADDWN